ncbi:putative pre-mRNA-splicing factor ATP-dependent RNA helicase prp43 [Fusarium oxysporum f. sp. albedinis]|nr:putative pre-mRNA-splicing factor ATP-dependent RNA helicase prp43 [Fusarium oxysporum f. sp. albedinis]
MDLSVSFPLSFHLVLPAFAAFSALCCRCAERPEVLGCLSVVPPAAAKRYSTVPAFFQAPRPNKTLAEQASTH